MGSFGNPHYLFLFEMRSGKQKLAHGKTPEDALNILRYRLSEAEMEEILTDSHVRISQRDLLKHIENLG